jgi:hypothetical protein
MVLQFFKLDLTRPLDETFLKSQWRKIALENHPDKGGDTEKFKAAIAEYEYILNNKCMGYTAQSDSPEAYENWEDFIFSVSEVVREMAYKCKPVVEKHNAVLEVCGTWIWVSSTRPSMSHELKGLGLQWASAKKKWFFAGTQKTSRGRMNMDNIRALYGSETYKTEKENKTLAIR